jgi:hypothetical protein
LHCHVCQPPFSLFFSAGAELAGAGFVSEAAGAATAGWLAGGTTSPAGDGACSFGRGASAAPVVGPAFAFSSVFVDSAGFTSGDFASAGFVSLGLTSGVFESVRVAVGDLAAVFSPGFFPLAFLSSATVF